MMTAPKDDKGSPPSEFKDPLSNFEPRKTGDRMEAALTEETVAAIESHPFTTVRPDLPIHGALRALVGLEIGCLLISEEDRLVGIFSARDVLDKVAGRFEQMKDRPVRDVMTPEPVCVYESDSTATALSAMAVGGYRHVPVLDASDRIVGIVGPQRVIAFLRQHFEQG